MYRVGRSCMVDIYGRETIKPTYYATGLNRHLHGGVAEGACLSQQLGHPSEPGSDRYHIWFVVCER